MIVGSFFAATKAIGGAISFMYLIATTRFSDDSPVDNVVQGLFAAQIGNSLGQIASFCVLFFAGRWMLKGPQMLERWISLSEEQQN